VLYNDKEPTASLVKENDESFEFNEQARAANAFLALRDAKAPHDKPSRIQRVYYYSFRAPTEAAVKLKPNAFDSGLFEAEPEPGGTKSHNEPRPAYCYLAYASHDCPPAIVTSELLQARVNPHGLPTTVELYFSGGGCGGGEFCSSPFEETLTASIGGGIIHPVAVSFPSKRSLCGAFSSYAVARNNGGTTTGPTVKVVNACK